MFDIVELIIVAVFATWIGWRVHEAFIIHIIRTNPKILEELAKVVEQHQDELGTEDITLVNTEGEKLETKGVELAVERVGNTLYAYAKATNQFIAQGDDIEALMKSAHKRFPGKTFFGELPEENQNS
jgi:hypothetical protein